MVGRGVQFREFGVNPNFKIHLFLIVSLPLILEYSVFLLDTQLWLGPTFLDNYLSTILHQGLTSSGEIMSSPVTILWFIHKILLKALFEILV